MAQKANSDRRLSGGHDGDDKAGPYHPNEPKMSKIVKYVKMFALLVTWLTFTIAFFTREGLEEEGTMLVVPATGELETPLEAGPKGHLLGVSVFGHFMPPEKRSKHNRPEEELLVQVQRVYFDAQHQPIKVENVSSPWYVTVVLAERITRVNHKFKLKQDEPEKLARADVQLRLFLATTHINEDLPIEVSINLTPIDPCIGVIYGTLVLIILYVLIIWDVVNRTFAAIITSTTALGILTLLNARPTFSKIIGWINFEPLLLLSQIMILVALLTETGIFDYMAVLIYKRAKGRLWHLYTYLCLMTALLSAFLDNMTIVLMLSPVALRLCEVTNIRTTPMLVSMVIFSNIGGAMTGVGDLPNVVICSNKYFMAKGISFYIFLLNMAPCAIMAIITALVQLHIHLRLADSFRNAEPEAVLKLQRQIAAWQKAANKLQPYSKFEEATKAKLMQQIQALNDLLYETIKEKTMLQEKEYENTLKMLQENYPIRHKNLLIKSVIALAFTIFLLCQEFLPINMCWSALMGSMLLIILYNNNVLEKVVGQMEWGTLLFLAALYVTMEAVDELGVVAWVEDKLIAIVASVEQKWRMEVAILLTVWLAAFTSSIVDNLSMTTFMIKLIIAIDQEQTLDLPILPLVWSLALGGSFGGNGTLIGAASNIVCAGVADAHGHRIAFMDFLKIGFPIMINTTIVATVYLYLRHAISE